MHKSPHFGAKGRIAAEEGGPFVRFFQIFANSGRRWPAFLLRFRRQESAHRPRARGLDNLGGAPRFFFNDGFKGEALFPQGKPDAARGGIKRMVMKAKNHRETKAAKESIKAYTGKD